MCSHTYDVILFHKSLTVTNRAKYLKKPLGNLNQYKLFTDILRMYLKVMLYLYLQLSLTTSLHLISNFLT